MSEQGQPPHADRPVDSADNPDVADAPPSATEAQPPPPPPPGAAPARRVKKAVKKAPSGRTTGGGPARPDGPPKTPKTPKPPKPPDDAAAALRGYAVIGVTIVIGLIFFRQGLQKNDAPTITASNVTTSVPLNTPTTDRNAPPPTTAASQGTTIAPKAPTTKVAPKDLKVLVTNGVDATKTIAGPNATKLTAAGYTVSGTGDLPPPAVETSAVYFSPDYQGDAVAVAKVLGIPEANALAMPTKPPAPLNGANLLVVIGKDKG